MSLFCECYNVEMYPTRNYSTIENKLKTGDLLLFSSNGFFSNIIKVATMSPYSHIGMVVKIDNNQKFKDIYNGNDELFLWHSPKDVIEGKNRDILTKTEKNGPQLNPLKRILLKTNSKVVLRRLDKTTKEITSLRNVKFNNSNNLLNYMKKESIKIYERNYLDLFYSSYDGPFGQQKQNNESEFFCSELVAATYIKMGLLDDTLPTDEYTPEDFNSKRKLELLDNWNLRKEIKLKF